MVDADPVTTAFQGINSRQLRWAIVKVDTTSTVTLAATGPRSDGIAELVAALSATEPCYVVYDFEAEKEDGAKMTKTIFVAYSPDECKVMGLKMALMQYAGNVKSKGSFSCEKQINDINDFNENEFRSYFNLPRI